MASSTTGYVCRSCRHILRSSKLLPRSTTGARPFSSSTSYAKALATFHPTASPELDTLLSRWRSEIFLPAILPPEHQRLIYKQSKRDILIQPPGISVTVQRLPPPSAQNGVDAGEEVIKLVPLSRLNQPNKKQSLNKIIHELSNTSEPAAWDNIVPFLAGSKLARVQLPRNLMASLARKANLQNEGRWKTILTAATMVKRTGISLSNVQLTRELVTGCFQRAVAANFASKEPVETLDQILRLLEAPEHCGALDFTEPGDADTRRDPLVIAVKLSFSAARALRDFSKKDQDHDVAHDAQKLLSIEKSIKRGILEGEKENIKDHISMHRRPTDSTVVFNHRLLENLFVYQCAIALAKRVDMKASLRKDKNVEVTLGLDKLENTISKQISTCLESLKSEDKHAGKRRYESIQKDVEKALKEL